MIRPEDFEDDDDMDEDEFEEWCAMSEDQQDAILEASMREAIEIRSKADPARLYAHDRKQKLMSIIRWRRLLREQNLIGGFFHDQLKERQRSLLRRRVQYYHGTLGSA